MACTSVLVGPDVMATPVSTVVPPFAITVPLDVPAFTVTVGTVGAVRSIVIVEPSAFDPGPVALAVLVTEFEVSCGITVPSEQPDTLTVNTVVDVDVTEDTVQPVAVCDDENWKSDSVSVAVSTSLVKVSVYERDPVVLVSDVVDVNDATANAAQRIATNPLPPFPPIP